MSEIKTVSTMIYKTADGSYQTQFAAVRCVVENQLSKMKQVGDRKPVCVKTVVSPTLSTIGVQYWTQEMVEKAQNTNTDGTTAVYVDTTPVYCVVETYPASGRPTGNCLYEGTDWEYADKLAWKNDNSHLCNGTFAENVSPNGFRK